MAKHDSESGMETFIDALSLDEANQRPRALSGQQTVVNLDNQEMKHKRKALRTQKQKGSSPKESTSTDIDRQKQTETEYSTDKGLLRCIIDSVSDFIFVKDCEGIYRGCNKASEWLVGLTESEQIGKTDFDFLDRELAETVQARDRQILMSGQEHCVEEWVPSPDGGMILLESKKNPFYGPDGKAAGIVGIARDITAHRQSENTLKKANRELEAFAQTVAHDLRSPLTPIIGYAELLRKKYRERLDERALEYLDEIIASGKEMRLMMKDLLSLATAGQVEKPGVPLDSREVVQTVVKGLTGQLALAGVSVTIGDLPPLRIPKTHLIQVFDNLILNAMKYGCKSGDVIEVGGKRNDERVSLYVRDHGPGIQPSEREHIFEVFYRGTTEEETQGTGIGLATVQKIAGLFDGRAWADETPGGGSTFWVEIVDVLMCILERVSVARMATVKPHGWVHASLERVRVGTSFPKWSELDNQIIKITCSEAPIHKSPTTRHDHILRTR